MKTLLKSTLALAVIAGATAPAMAEQGDWLFRLRALHVVPDESAQISPIAGTADIDTSIVPELDISYFFTDHIAAELILAVTPHDVMARGTALGDVDLGDVTLLPPTLTLQYHFNPEGQISPYVGAGVNYTIFFDEDLPAGSPLVDIDYSESFGGALQAGVDYRLNDRWFLNADLKKVWIQTDVTIDAGGLGTVTGDVDIDPWIFGIGLGFRY